MPHGDTKRVSHVRRREIQAPVVAAIIEGFAQEIGRERALGIVARVIEREAKVDGKQAAEQYGPSIEGLFHLIEEVWCEDGGMEIRVLEKTSTELSFDVTRCGYAEAYRRLGLRELGACLSCSRDVPHARAFAPGLELVRTKTIMEGADVCDFRYRLKSSSTEE